MNVCFVSLSAYGYFNSDAEAEPGGAQRQLFLLSQELKSSHTISFVVGDYGQQSIEHRQGVTLYSAYRPNTDATMLERMKQIQKLYSAMRRADADVYVYRGNPRKASVTYLLTRMLRAEWVYNVANDADLEQRFDKLNRAGKIVFKSALSSASSVIAQTEYQKEVLQERFDMDSVVISNGYPRSSVNLPYEERAHILWVGSFDADQKRPHLLLDLAEKLPDLDFKLIGPRDQSDPYCQEITDRAEKLDNVRDLGYVEPDWIHTEFESAIALVNTSAYEGFPNVFLEAWRVGTPAISHSINVDRFGDFEIPGYPPEDFDELIEVINRLWTERNYWNRLSKSSLSLFIDKYTINKIANNYQQVLLKNL